MRLWLAGALFLCACGSRPAGAGERPPARVQYLQNSGWLVLTEHHALLFDYVTHVGDQPDLPADLRLHARQFAPRSTVVFVSHGHLDHYSRADVADVTAADPSALVISGMDVDLPRAHVMRPHEHWTAPGIDVLATDSTDEGVAFLVTVDGLTIFHAGDLAAWTEETRPAFDAEIRWARSHAASVDLAFFPIATGAACEPRPVMRDGVVDAALQLKPRFLFPMHVRCDDRLSLYAAFRDAVKERLPGTKVMVATHRGEWLE